MLSNHMATNFKGKLTFLLMNFRLKVGYITQNDIFSLACSAIHEPPSASHSMNESAHACRFPPQISAFYLDFHLKMDFVMQ